MPFDLHAPRIPRMTDAEQMKWNRTLRRRKRRARRSGIGDTDG